MAIDMRPDWGEKLLGGMIAKQELELSKEAQKLAEKQAELQERQFQQTVAEWDFKRAQIEEIKAQQTNLQDLLGLGERPPMPPEYLFAKAQDVMADENAAQQFGRDLEMERRRSSAAERLARIGEEGAWQRAQLAAGTAAADRQLDADKLAVQMYQVQQDDLQSLLESGLYDLPTASDIVFGNKEAYKLPAMTHITRFRQFLKEDGADISEWLGARTARVVGVHVAAIPDTDVRQWMSQTNLSEFMQGVLQGYMEPQEAFDQWVEATNKAFDAEETQKDFKKQFGRKGWKEALEDMRTRALQYGHQVFSGSLHQMDIEPAPGVPPLERPQAPATPQAGVGQRIGQGVAESPMARFFSLTAPPEEARDWFRQQLFEPQEQKGPLTLQDLLGPVRVP